MGRKAFQINSVVHLTTIDPIQYRGFFKDGRLFYIRFKNQFLTMHISKEPTGNIKDIISNAPIYRETIETEYLSWSKIMTCIQVRFPSFKY